MGMALFFSFLSFVFYIGAFVISIYCLVLFIKLARRGIRALDLYIQEKENKNV